MPPTNGVRLTVVAVWPIDINLYRLIRSVARAYNMSVNTERFICEQNVFGKGMWLKHVI